MIQKNEEDFNVLTWKDLQDSVLGENSSVYGTLSFV